MAVVNAALADVPLAELLPRLAELGIPAGEVRTLDRVYEWEQTRSQGLVIDVDDPLLWSIEIPGPPIRLDDNVFAGGRETHTHPPLLGDSPRAFSPGSTPRASYHAGAEHSWSGGTGPGWGLGLELR